MSLSRLFHVSSCFTAAFSMFHWAISFTLCASMLLGLVEGLIVTAPKAGQNVSLADPFVIEWKEER